MQRRAALTCSLSAQSEPCDAFLFTPQTHHLPARLHIVKFPPSSSFQTPPAFSSENVLPFKHDKEAIEVAITIIHHVYQWLDPALR